MNECLVEDCHRVRVTSTGLCNMHRMRLSQNGSVGEAAPRWNLVEDGKKFCKMCERTLDISMFKGPKSKPILTYCNECYPDYIKYRNIKSKFGLTKREYDELISNGCALCGDTHRLAIDHNHECCPGLRSCGKCIRGVLCMRHNLMLGHSRDSIKELELAIQYLKDTEN